MVRGCLEDTGRFGLAIGDSSDETDLLLRASVPESHHCCYRASAHAEDESSNRWARGCKTLYIWSDGGAVYLLVLQVLSILLANYSP